MSIGERESERTAAGREGEDSDHHVDDAGMDPGVRLHARAGGVDGRLHVGEDPSDERQQGGHRGSDAYGHWRSWSRTSRMGGGGGQPVIINNNNVDNSVKSSSRQNISVPESTRTNESTLRALQMAA